MPSWQFESLLWSNSSGFPLANRLALPGSESVFGASQYPRCVHLHLLAKMDSSKERQVLWGGAPPFDLQGDFLHTCSREDTLKNEEYVVFYLVSGQDSAPLSLLLFWGICPQRRNSSSTWGPSLSCLKMTTPPMGATA